jgi:hypothetical protein
VCFPDDPQMSRKLCKHGRTYQCGECLAEARAEKAKAEVAALKAQFEAAAAQTYCGQCGNDNAKAEVATLKAKLALADRMVAAAKHRNHEDDLGQKLGLGHRHCSLCQTLDAYLAAGKPKESGL